MTEPAPIPRREGLPWWSYLLASVVISLFVWNVRQYWFHSDDGFISFRYAKHLVEGHGLVWNPGERVEGYTNFLWVIMMALGMLMGYQPEDSTLLMGIASGAGILFTLAHVSGRRYGWRSGWIWAAPLWLAAHRSFTAWSTSGLATTFFALLGLLGLVMAVRESQTGEKPWRSGLLLALCTLTRPDGIVFVGAAGLLLGIDFLRKRRTWRDLLWWGIPILVLVGGHTIFRLAYYGYPFPNTFYAKVPSAFWDQGFKYLALFFDDYHFHWWAPFAGLSLVARRTRLHVTFAVFLGLWTLYILYVGGDFLGFRFMVPAMAAYAFLVVDGLKWITELKLPYRLNHVVHAGMAVLMFHIADHTYERAFHPDINQHRVGVESVAAARHYSNRRKRHGVFIGRLVKKGVLSKDLQLSTGGCGALPYYAGLRVVDIYGLNDEYIAHLPLEKRVDERVGHERMAPPEYLLERKVEMIDSVAGGLVTKRKLCPRRIRQKWYEGPLYCANVDGHWLNFGSALSLEELRRAMPKLNIVTR